MAANAKQTLRLVARRHGFVLVFDYMCRCVVGLGLAISVSSEGLLVLSFLPAHAGFRHERFTPRASIVQFLFRSPMASLFHRFVFLSVFFGQ